jgi:protein-S-isoprenylcysteine O-methyltransferase Ste14
LADVAVRLGGWLFRRRGWLPVPMFALVLLVAPSRWEGLVVVAAGEAVRLAAVGHIGGPSRTRGDDVGPLVRTGPYGRVRNPLYVGNILLWSGVALVAWPSVLLVLPTMILYYSLIVRWEEDNLRRSLGGPYEAYLREVPRWLPFGRGGGGGWSLRRALRTERGTFVVLAAVLGALLLRSRFG